MTNVDARDYDRVKVAIFQRYDIKEETYRRHFRSIKPLENETPVELVIRVKDLAEKWLKDCRDRDAVVGAVVKEQFVEYTSRGGKGLGKGEETQYCSGSW